MIPLDSCAAVIPRVETTGIRQNSIALTINQLKSNTSSPTNNTSFSPGIRIVQSRTQTRRSSLSSLYSLVKFEEEELVRLNSRGSGVGLFNGQGLRNCLETKQLNTKERVDSRNRKNTENSSCSSTEYKNIESEFIHL